MPLPVDAPIAVEASVAVDAPAEVAVEAPAEPAEVASPPRWPRYVVPTLEVAALDFGVWAYDRALGEEWAFIDAGSVADNLRYGFQWDDDGYPTNFFLHPYQGATYHACARSGGLTFWEALPYSFTGSLVWEVFLEVQAPSTNDQITAFVGGAFLGEALFRTSRSILGPERTTVGRRLLAAPIDPMGGLNDLGWGGRIRRETGVGPGPWRMRVEAGAATSALRDHSWRAVPPSARFQLGATEGPGDFHAPFDHYDVWLDAAVNSLQPDMEDPAGPTWDFLVRGLLVAADVGGGPNAGPRGGSGLAGLYGVFTFTGPVTTRSSASALAPGVVLTGPVGDGTWTFSALAGPGFGTAGGAVPQVNELDHRYSLLVVGTADARLDVGRVSARARVDEVYAPYSFTGEGADDVTIALGSFTVRVWGPHGVALTGGAARRWSTPAVDEPTGWASAGVAYAFEPVW